MAALDESMPAVKSDSERLLDLINSYVLIHTIFGNYEGFVDSIDPVTKSVILSKKVDGLSKTTLIMGSTIQEMECGEIPEGCERVQIAEGENLSQEALIMKKDEVKSWLLRNLLPVEEEEDVLKLKGLNLTILPPYRADDCICTNTLVLGRVQHLLQNVPKD